VTSPKRISFGRDSVRWWLGLTFLIFAAGGIALIVWGLEGGGAGLAVTGALVAAFGGYEGLAGLYPHLVVDDRGVRWRRLGRSGQLSWSNITAVSKSERRRRLGEHEILCSAELRTSDGRSVVVARGTLEQPWDKGELTRFAALVREEIKARR
jgi:hypothetical protein